MAVLNLTEARIRELELGSGIWRDEQVKGLMVICHARTKTYAVQGDVRRNGLREARNRAKAMLPQIRKYETAFDSKLILRARQESARH